MKTRFLVLTGMILAAALTRLLPHPQNFAPITAIALFGGAHFANKKQAFLVPFAAMMLSDLILGFHSTMLPVYTSFALIVLIGFSLRDKTSAGRIVAASFASSVLFFVVTNFGTWAFQSLYPKTLEGLATCYAMALPFFQNTLLGDAIYVATLFGGFALLENRLPRLKMQAAASFSGSL